MGVACYSVLLSLTFSVRKLMVFTGTLYYVNWLRSTPKSAACMRVSALAFGAWQHDTWVTIRDR